MSDMFANGTEGDAWMHVWCNVCDHEPTCTILDAIWCGETPPAITLEPKGTFHLPALHLCAEFQNADDPYAEARANAQAFVALAAGEGT